MSRLGTHRGRRQPEYCVTWYALGKQPINDLHGIFINVGTYDTLKEAEDDATRIRLEIKDVGGRVRVHMTGHPEALHGDDFKYATNRKLVGDDMNLMHNAKEQEAREKRAEEKRQIDQRRKETEQEEKELDDPTSLESYAQLHIRRRMMEENIVAQAHNLKVAQVKMIELKKEISERDEVKPEYQHQWRGLIKEKIGTDQVFILQERVDQEAPAVDIEEEFKRVVEVASSQ